MSSKEYSSGARLQKQLHKPLDIQLQVLRKGVRSLDTRCTGDNIQYNSNVITVQEMRMGWIGNI